MTDALRFTLDDPTALGPLLAELGERTDLVADGRTDERRTVLDTFDWRVWRDGGVLEHVRPPRGSGDRPELRWRHPEGRVRARATTAKPPRFASDLPVGPMADELGPVLDVRALLPVASVEVATTVLRRLDDEDKTVARLVVTAGDLDGGGELPVLVEVVPVRGYDRQARRLADELADLDALRPGGADVAELAARAAGGSPGAYSSKLRLTLDPGATAGEAWGVVLRELLATLRANEAGTRDDLDSEFLHDLRVAVRRTRSVLAQGKGVLDPEARSRFADGFRWLGAATSPTRDLDVWLLTLPELAAGIDESLGPELDTLRRLLVRHQRREQRRLVRALDSDRYERMLERYAVWLTDPAGTPEAAPDAERSAPAVAGHRIARAFRRVERDGRRIDDASPPEALHQLRKDAKRLRYGLECFGSLFAAELTQPLVRDLKALQDVLGEFQDCEVEMTTLRSYADELAAASSGSGPLLAMGALVEGLAERQRAARATFAERFERFDTKANRRRVSSIADGGSGS